MLVEIPKEWLFNSSTLFLPYHSIVGFTSREGGFAVVTLTNKIHLNYTESDILYLNCSIDEFKEYINRNLLGNEFHFKLNKELSE